MLADLSRYSADLCHAPLRSFAVLWDPLLSFAVFSHTIPHHWFKRESINKHILFDLDL